MSATGTSIWIPTNKSTMNQYLNTYKSLQWDIDTRWGDVPVRGNVGAQKLTLRGVDRVTGFMGEPIVGWNVVAQQTGEKLVGQLGSTVLGRPFELDLGSAPGWVGTLVAVVAFYALEPRANVTVG